MDILISNDDGIHASGIGFLKEELSKDNKVITVAPNKERSSCGHAITLGEPIRLKKVTDSEYACSGFPADCILVGLGQLYKDKKPDLVVSGVNHGANLGQDRFYSGTIAAAREASFRGVAAIAVSLVTKSLKDVEHFDVASRFVSKLIKHDIHTLIPKMHVLNINVPNLKEEEIAGVKLTFAGHQNYSEEVVQRLDTRGNEYYWVGGTYRGPQDLKGSDGNAIAENYISVDLQDLRGNTATSTSELRQLIEKLE